MRYLFFSLLLMLVQPNCSAQASAAMKLGNIVYFEVLVFDTKAQEPIQDADLLVEGTSPEHYTTDKNGKAGVKFEKGVSYLLSAKKAGYKDSLKYPIEGSRLFEIPAGGMFIIQIPLEPEKN